MAFRNVAVPMLSGGLLVLGYAAFSWLRGKRTGHERSEHTLSRARRVDVQPLSARLEHIPDELVLDLESEHLPANTNALSRSADLGALFLGRASEALSPFHWGPQWPDVRR